MRTADGAMWPRASTPLPGNRRGTGGMLPPIATRFKPGVSGNLSGRPQGDGLMRKRLMKSFLANEKAAMAAMARRWASTRYVQDMWELLAKLEGELSKDASEHARGIQVLILNNKGAHPLDPEVFREAARRKALEQRDGLVDEGD